MPAASSTSRPVRPSTTASVVPGDARGDRRRAARGGLGDRHPPAFVRRRAREHPRAPVEVDERRRRRRGPGSEIQSRRAELVRSAPRAPRARSPRRRSPRAARDGVPCTRRARRSSRSKRFTGTSRPTATTSGVGDARRRPGENDGSMPGGTTVMRCALRCSLRDDLVLRRLRQRDDRRARGRSAARRRNSTRRPSRASRGGSVISHIESCTWCSHTTRGRRAHNGEKNGMPFQISTSASLAPCQPIISLNAARGNTR